MQRRTDEQCGNLTDLVKNIVLGFCKINVPYADRLDVYGSVHIRADGCDVANFMLNEHCYNSRASSPTVTSAQPVDHELAGNDGNSRDGSHVSQKNLQKVTVKPETSAENEKTDWSQWQWSETESAAVRQQTAVRSNDQPVNAPLDNVSHGSSVMSKNCISDAATDVKGHAVDVKCEKLDAEAAVNTAVNDDNLSNDGSVEILDDDPAEYDDDDDSEYKPDFVKTEEECESEMSFGYDDFAQYDNPSASVYQYSNASSNSYLSNQPRAGSSAKRLKASASSVGQNARSSSEKICAFCRERFVSDAELYAHFQQYHQCNRPPGHKSRKTSSRHMDQTPNSMVTVGTEENVVKMYKCRFCGQLYRSQDGLRNHENVNHSRNKRYQCNFCSQEFLTRQAAYTHRIKFHRLLSRKMQ